MKLDKSRANLNCVRGDSKTGFNNKLSLNPLIIKRYSDMYTGLYQFIQKVCSLMSARRSARAHAFLERAAYTLWEEIWREEILTDLADCFKNRQNPPKLLPAKLIIFLNPPKLIPAKLTYFCAWLQKCKK